MFGYELWVDAQLINVSDSTDAQMCMSEVRHVPYFGNVSSTSPSAEVPNSSDIIAKYDGSWSGFPDRGLPSYWSIRFPD